MIRRRFFSNRQEYMTLEPLVDGVCLNITKRTTLFPKEFYYSIDNGEWVYVSNLWDFPTQSFNAGQTIRFKSKSFGASLIFDMTGPYIVYGSAMSLINNQTHMLDESFAFLFENSVNLISVSESFLPATTLSTMCYASMFNGCTSLLSGPNLPAREVSDDDYIYMFEDCSSLSKIPEIYYIDSHMFNGCSSLVDITIPNGVTSIGYAAFENCDILTSITIPASVTWIEANAFSKCYIFPNSFNNNSLLDAEQNDYWGCTMYDTLQSDGLVLLEDTVMGCLSNSISVTIPDSVTSIRDSAFSQHETLTSITIGNSVTSIGNYAFNDCNNLTSVTIPDSVTQIGDRAFYSCSSLTSATVGNSVTEIGNYAFAYCSSLTDITIGNGVTSIGTNAFYNCKSLTSITIGNSVTSIKSDTFYGCTALTSVTIPDRVTSIGDWAFSDCTSLKEVYCKPTTPPTGGYNMLNNNAADRKIYVPAASVEAYKAASSWSRYTSSIVGYNF